MSGLKNVKTSRSRGPPGSKFVTIQWTSRRNQAGKRMKLCFRAVPKSG